MSSFVAYNICTLATSFIMTSNMVMGIGHKASLVYLIYFGLSKQFRDLKTHIHIPFSNADMTHQLTGSAAFTSIHSHSGQELSRRDDLESLAYISSWFVTVAAFERGGLSAEN